MNVIIERMKKKRKGNQNTVRASNKLSTPEGDAVAARAAKHIFYVKSFMRDLFWPFSFVSN